MNFNGIPIVQREDYPVTDSVKINGSPGTGKTTQSFRRYIEALQERGCDVEDTCVVSYRVALANDLMRRLNHQGIIGDYELQDTGGRTKYFGTIHGVCRRLLGGDLDMVTQSDRAAWCAQRNWDYYGKDKNGDTVGELFFDIIDWLTINEKTSTDASVAPQFDDFCREFRPIDFSTPIQSWVEYKEENDLYDFHDLFNLVLSEEIVPDVEMLVVDEMHDVFPLMNSVIEMWVSEVKENGGTVIVAGDTQQVINEYQGADAKYFNGLGLPEITLQKQHERPPRPHWNLAMDMLAKSHEPREIENNINGTVSHVNSPELPNIGNNAPQHLLSEHGREDDTVMFLARSRSQCRAISKSLRQAGILFKGSGGTLAWTRRESPERVAIYHVLQQLTRFSGDSVEQDGWVKDDLALVDDSSLSFNADDFTYFVQNLPARYLVEDKADVEHELETVESVPISQVVEYTTAAFWNEITNGPESLELLLIDDNVRSWLKPALLVNDRGIPDSESLTITVQTIHASKGSEADVVLLYDGIPPKTQDAIYNSEDSRQNEHRVWYVALTRSKRDLVIVDGAYDWAADYLTRNLAGDALC